MQPPLYFVFSLINSYITEDISSVKVLSCLSTLKIYILGFNRFTMLFQLQVYSKANQLYIYPVFPCGSDGKHSACNVGDLNLIPWLGRSPGKGHGNRLQYSCLENPHEQRSLEGYSPWGCKELDTTERLSTYIYPLFFRLFAHIDRFRVLRRVLCAMQEALISYRFYIKYCVYVSPNLPIYPFPPVAVSLLFTSMAITVLPIIFIFF